MIINKQRIISQKYSLSQHWYYKKEKKMRNEASLIPGNKRKVTIYFFCFYELQKVLWKDLQNENISIFIRLFNIKMFPSFYSLSL